MKAKGIPTSVQDFKERRNLNKAELREYIGLVTLCNNQRWKSMQISHNTALIFEGQKVAKLEESITNLLDNARNNWIAQVLQDCGVPPGQAVSIDNETGVIEYAKTDKDLHEPHIKVEMKK